MKSEYSASVSISLACAGLLAALLVITPSLALAVPLFGIFVGGDCPITSTSINNSPVPVSDKMACTTAIGTGAAAASATFGSVGAEARTATVTGLSIPFAIGAAADFADTLTFSKTNPAAPNQFLVSLNLALGGTVNSGQGANFAQALVISE